MYGNCCPSVLRQIVLVVLVSLLQGCGGLSGPPDNQQAVNQQTITPQTKTTPVILYPETSVQSQSDNFFGVRVEDPYRWLEDDIRDSEPVAQWVERQNKVTFEYLNSLQQRTAFKEKLSSLWDFERFSRPVKRNNRYFYERNDGLQNQSVYYMQQGLEGSPQVLIDPNIWSDDGATALASAVPSPNGRYLAYAIQDGGSDWRTIKILEVDTGKVLHDVIHWAKFTGISWHPDGTGFYYSRFPKPDAEAFTGLNYDHTLYFHRLGTEQNQDKLIFARPDKPEVNVFSYVCADRFLIVLQSTGTDDAYEVAIQDLQSKAAAPTQIISGFKHNYYCIGAQERELFVVTNNQAERSRIVKIDLDQPQQSHWTEIVPEQTDVLADATIVGDTIIAQYLSDVKSVIRRYQYDGSPLGDIDLPGVGTAAGFNGRAQDNETFYSYSSFNTPTTIYRYDVTAGTSTVFKQPTVKFSPQEFTVRQIFYSSKDGTKIPMFIAHKAELDISQPQPTLLYGYGGFNISIQPYFSVTNLAWMDSGGVLAIANLRGGGEYGKAWHDGGRLLNKQNVFDDFIAAGEYLIAEGITSPNHLAIYGRSNGGLLVGAVTNQRPDLFAAALPAVGVMDMLRFDKFTAGRYWVDDYGKPSENQADFKNNFAYSPYHNIAAGKHYPAIMVITADTDDRVVPGHSFKYTAALQAADTGPKPQLIRIETRAGHGAGKPTEKIIEEYADMWAFLAEHTGLVVQ